DGVIVNCHYAGLVKFDMGEECGAICCRNSSGVVANSYYLASQSGANEYAKTADEFADGTVFNLLKNGIAEIADGDIWRQKIGVDKVPSFTEGSSNNQTPVTAVAKESDIKVWSFNRTIYIENAPADTKYEIVDLNGRIITTSKTKSTKEEIKINNKGVLIVKIGNNTYKVLI
ncbi:MAG: T9SS type A sorting domain-containing protein, partial [Bacteroidales bacterium]|nr:T9SS type A sorting domain-containing protein [Bacteroidales bacterium]